MISIQSLENRIAELEKIVHQQQSALATMGKAMQMTPTAIGATVDTKVIAAMEIMALVLREALSQHDLDPERVASAIQKLREDTRSPVPKQILEWLDTISRILRDSRQLPSSFH